MGVAGDVDWYCYRYSNMGKRKDEEREEEELRGLLPAGWEGGIFEWRGVWEG